MDITSKIQKVSAAEFADEAALVASFLPHLEQFRGVNASNLLEVCSKTPKSLTQKIITKYDIKSPEGKAVMSLAECLLRVPDKETAYALIDDKLKSAKWVGDDALSLAIMLAAKMGSNAMVLAGIKQAIKLLGDEFVLGQTLEEAQKNAAKLKAKGYTISYDMLGEGARSYAQAEKYFASYKHAIENAGDDSVSIKISALHPKFELAKWEILQDELLPKLQELTRIANAKNVMLVIDAEEARRLEITLMVFAKLLQSGARCGLAVQAYQKRAPQVLEFLLGLASAHNYKIPVRLVKGAYWDAEIKYAQMHGLSNYPVFTSKQNTDLSYLYCAKFLADNAQHFYPQFATHNAHTVAALLTLGGDYEFQRLQGMGVELHDEILRLGKKSRIYAPVGEHEDLLSYLIRRLLENGANSSFVNKVAKGEVADFSLEPKFSALKLPLEIYSSRRNSAGYDLGNSIHFNELKAAVAKDIKVPDLSYKLPDNLPWNLPLEARAEILEKIAEEYEAHQFELINLLVSEGKKTISDAIAELREAVDFCRYYAAEARRVFAPKITEGITGEKNIYAHEGRGIFVCISPWNFPLAIFTGQIVAALVAGNKVIAKPAEQTPKAAKLAVSLMQKHKAPVELAIGAGESLGAKLVARPDVSGVCFTGSTEVAKIIQKSIAANNAAIIPLIAETGGQNAMIVDSTALPEQAADDIILSAFGSAGQRCSALRVCYIHEGIFDELVTILKGAMDAMTIGNSADFATDMGEVIDEEAKKVLEAHIKKMQSKLVHATKAPSGVFVAPHIFEISSINELEREVFGPILHIRKFKNIDEVVAEVNASPYALTFGIHTRIEGRAVEIAEKIKAGNIYVNRGMTGAVVESQPFGGFGLSGTGPKAGGPEYLLRFAHEKLTTINTTAMGGNLDLL